MGEYNYKKYRAKQSTKKPFYKSKNFYKKQLNRIIICIIILAIILIFKKINTKFTNKSIEIIKDKMEYNFSIKDDGKKILDYCKKVGKLPSKIMSTFKHDDVTGQEEINKYQIPLEGKVYKKFGKTEENGEEKYNDGIDIIPENDKIVYSICDGTISKVQDKGNLGKYIIVDHGEFKAVYGHLNQLSIDEKQKVKKGEELGSLGEKNVGNGYLHLEIWEESQPIDPLTILDYNDKESFSDTIKASNSY